MATAALHSFNLFLTERLTAAAGDIFSFVERTLEEYQEEVQRTRQENHRLQRLLDMVYQPHIRLHRADSKLTTTLTSTEETPTLKEDWTPDVCQDEPRPSQIKEEETEAVWTDGGECLSLTEDSKDGDRKPNVCQDEPRPSRIKEEATEVALTERSEGLSLTDDSHDEDLTPNMCQDEPRPSQIEEEQTEGRRTNESKDLSLTEDSHDGDVLTKELSNNAQRLQSCRSGQRITKPATKDKGPPKERTTFYRCHICNYIFTKKTVLDWHLKTHEDTIKCGKRLFVCHVCGKRISCQSHLQNHMRVHTGERPYSCSFCGKSFKLKGHMTEHVRTHTGEKPFSCHVCGMSFNRGYVLRKHVLAKHKS